MLMQRNARDPLVIGRRAIVGMGVVVPEGMTMVENPAKELNNED
jgi:hypothetical protein